MLIIKQCQALNGPVTINFAIIMGEQYYDINCREGMTQVEHLNVSCKIQDIKYLFKTSFFDSISPGHHQISRIFVFTELTNHFPL